MTAKEYLVRLGELDIKIKQKENQIEELKSLSTSVAAVCFSSDKASGGGTAGDARFTEMIADIDRLEWEIRTDKVGFEVEKNKITNQIFLLHNPKFITLLYKRYVEFKPLCKIADEMGYSYDNIRHAHGYALLNFSEMFLKDDTQ